MRCCLWIYFYLYVCLLMFLVYWCNRCNVCKDVYIYQIRSCHYFLFLKTVSNLVYANWGLVSVPMFTRFILLVQEVSYFLTLDVSFDFFRIFQCLLLKCIYLCTINWVRMKNCLLCYNTVNNFTETCIYLYYDIYFILWSILFDLEIK